MKKLLLIAIVLLAAALPAAASAAGVSFVPRLSVYADAKDAPMKNPEGVACTGNELVVADTGNGRLLIYSLDEAALKAVSEVRLPQVPYPTRTEITSKGEIMVLDGKLKKVARLGPKGEFKGYVEPRGIPGGAAPVPTGFRLDASDNIYIADIASGCVEVLGPDGKFLRKIDFPKDARFISDVCVDKSGTVYVLDSLNSQVYSADKSAGAFAPFTKTFREYAGFPVYMMMDERNSLFIVDSHGGGIIVVGQDGSFQGRQLSLGWNEGLLYYPQQLCVTGKGVAFIADRGNSRVGVFSLVR